MADIICCILINLIPLLHCSVHDVVLQLTDLLSATTAADNDNENNYEFKNYCSVWLMNSVVALLAHRV